MDLHETLAELSPLVPEWHELGVDVDDDAEPADAGIDHEAVVEAGPDDVEPIKAGETAVARSRTDVVPRIAGFHSRAELGLRRPVSYNIAPATRCRVAAARCGPTAGPTSSVTTFPDDRISNSSRHQQQHPHQPRQAQHPGPGARPLRCPLVDRATYHCRTTGSPGHRDACYWSTSGHGHRDACYWSTSSGLWCPGEPSAQSSCDCCI